jgi:hypothetical protein
MIQWNELTFEQQQKILACIEDLLLRQTDIDMQDGLVAAMTELETWSHSPCSIQDTDEFGHYIAMATDPFPEER